MGNTYYRSMAGSDATTNSFVFHGGTVVSQNIRIHYGGVDGVNNSINWNFHIDLGTKFGDFDYTITGLNPGQIYYVTISDYGETDWANDPTNPAKHTRYFSTNYEPQCIPNALSAGRMLTHVRTKLCAKAAAPVCRKQFLQSWTGNKQDRTDPTDIKMFYAVDNATVTIDYSTGASAGFFHYTETFSTYNPDGSLRFSYSPQDQSSPPRDSDSDVGVNGVILPVASRPQGSGYLNQDGTTTTFPNEAWLLQKGTWRLDITTSVDTGIPAIGGGAHYPITLFAEPHAIQNLNSTGGRPKTVFYNGAVSGTSGGAPVSTTVYTFLRACCYWQIYFCLGVDTHNAGIPNNAHLCSFTVVATRMAG